ncbi:MAG: nucleotidyl transferase AbiEii/AbiGii toxin family protein [Pyramidobacter sp.]
MRYITGLQALNLTCSLDTTGDWHQPCLDWRHLLLWDTDTAFYKDYGIEENSHVPEHPGETFKTANHIRALLDMLYARDFGNAQGMNRNFIDQPLYEGEIFAKVMKMRRLPYWNEIDRFMEREFLMRWVSFRGRSENKVQRGTIKDVWEKRQAVVSDFLRDLNARSHAFILKGEAALVQCYGLDRIPQGIEFDAIHQDIIPFIRDFCGRRSLSYSIVEDTAAVKRAMIHCGATAQFLKIEASSRDTAIAPFSVNCIHGIQVYTLDKLGAMKALAYANQGTIRDLFDVVFIYNNHKQDLSPVTLDLLKDSIKNKGLEYVDYLLKTQNDEFIDKEKLLSSFLGMYDDMRLLCDVDEKQMLLSTKSKTHGGEIFR